MKLRAYLLILVVLATGCGKKPSEALTSNKAASNSEQFINKQSRIIKDHAKILVAMGHMPSGSVGSMYTVLGKYAWHGGKNGGYFGAYSFYEPAFEQAKRAWFMHGEVLEGSNEFWPQDDWDSDNQRHEIKFDASIIGYTLPPMSMFWYQDGKHKGESFTAKIIGIKDDGHTLILDRRAPHHAEQWGMQIVPADWQDMCRCTNNFGPEFINNRPVVEDAQ